MNILSLIKLLFASKQIMSDIPVTPANSIVPEAAAAPVAAPAAAPSVSAVLSEGVQVVEDVVNDVAAVKAGQVPTNIIQQIEDVEKFGEAVLQIGSILSTEFGVHPGNLKDFLPEVLALAKKLI